MKKQKEKKRIQMKKNQEKGITLIALVITIIVLLILAGVTIAALTGDNGILSRATDAREQTDIAEEKEKVQLSVLGALAQNNGEEITRGNLNKEFTSNIGKENTDYTLTQSETAPFVVTYLDSRRSYIINANGNITEAGVNENPGIIPPEINITLEQAKDDSMLEKMGNSKVTVDDGTLTVPAGFKVAKDSGNTLDEGIIIEDEKKNQFVWVPVTKENFNTQFQRRPGYVSNTLQSMTNYGEANSTGNNTNSEVTESVTTKSEAQEMYNSVYNNEGFYIG